MLSETRMDIWIPKLAQYQIDCTAHQEEGLRLNRNFTALISDLIEWEVVDGDQELILARYKAQGYPITPRVRKDVYRAFQAAGPMANGTATAGRKQAIARVIAGVTGYGKTAISDIKETQDFMDEGKKKSALWNLLQKIAKRFWWPLGQIVRMHYDVINWDDVRKSLEKFIQAWEVQYTPELEANKAEDKVGKG
jgi:hypothetical protein